VLGTRNHWGRANAFAPQGDSPAIDYSWERPTWVDWCVVGHRATREAIAVFNQTSFSKYVVVGADAESALQWICTADVAVPVGRTVYTGMLNEGGTYESDVTVTRTGEREFLVVSSAATTVRDLDWMRRHVPVGVDASVVDVTSGWGATISVGLALVGDREAGEATGDWVRTGEWTVDVAGDRHPLTVGLRPPLDPHGLRLGRTASDTHNGSFSDH